MRKNGFKPVNRYLYINIPEPEPPTTSSGIVLPESFKPTEEKYVVACVRDWADDVRFADLLTEKCKVMVDKSMIEEFTLNGGQYTVVLDNYVIGII